MRKTLDEIIDKIHEEQTTEQIEAISKESLYDAYLDEKYRENEVDDSLDAIKYILGPKVNAGDFYGLFDADILKFTSAFQGYVPFNDFLWTLTKTALLKYEFALKKMGAIYCNTLLTMQQWLDMLSVHIRKTDDWAIKMKKELDSILN